MAAAAIVCVSSILKLFSKQYKTVIVPILKHALKRLFCIMAITRPEFQTYFVNGKGPGYSFGGCVRDLN